MERFLPIADHRLGPIFSKMSEEGFLGHVRSLDRDGKMELLKALAKNWLAQDGVWFQAVEGRKGIEAAMGANDAAWVTLRE